MGAVCTFQRSNPVPKVVLAGSGLPHIGYYLTVFGNNTRFMNLKLLGLRFNRRLGWLSLVKSEGRRVGWGSILVSVVKAAALPPNGGWPAL